MGYWAVLGLRGFGLGNFMQSIGVLVVRVQQGRWDSLVGCKIFAKACDLGSFRMIA